MFLFMCVCVRALNTIGACKTLDNFNTNTFVKCVSVECLCSNDSTVCMRGARATVKERQRMSETNQNEEEKL